MNKWIPFAVPAIVAAWILGSLIPQKDKPGQFASVAFGSIPVVEGGRVQPLDSLARNSLLQLRGKQTASSTPWDEKTTILSASSWLMKMALAPDEANEIPVFRIDNPDLKGLLALPPDADKAKKMDGKHYSWMQIKGKLEPLQNEAQRAGKVEASRRQPYDQAVLKIWNGVGIYMKLQNMVEPQNAKNWPVELNEFAASVEPGVAAVRAQQAGQTNYDKAAFDKILMDAQRFSTMADLQPPLVVPPENAGGKHSDWSRAGSALLRVARGEPVPYALTAYANMSGAYRAGNVEQFNTVVQSYLKALSARFASDEAKARHEQFFNSYAPFYKAMTPYVFAFVFVLIFWLAPTSGEWARKTAVWLVVLAWVVHASGLVFRMVLEGRPPVTNLYSSAVFIGFGAVILGLILERVWRNGIGLVISSSLGFISLIIAHHLSLSGDTMEMLRAVLDTNFWLATHVVVVTLGYASTFVAGFLGLLYIILGIFTPNLGRRLTSGEEPPRVNAPEMGKSLNKMIYGILCFATLFSFVGTILGGIWADQSWGRFWGWDPKENGALIIVLWNALILHARWGGLVRERGLACLAIGGNIVTSWSWFGVNMLGVGLHAYGFTDAAFVWLIIFVVSQLVFILLGQLPLRFWRSFRASSKPLPETGAGAAA